MQHKIILLFAILLSLSVPAPSLAQDGSSNDLPKTVSSLSSNLTIQMPDDWSLMTGEGGVIYIGNYDDSSRIAEQLFGDTWESPAKGQVHITLLEASVYVNAFGVLPIFDSPADAIQDFFGNNRISTADIELLQGVVGARYDGSAILSEGEDFTTYVYTVEIGGLYQNAVVTSNAEDFAESLPLVDAIIASMNYPLLAELAEAEAVADEGIISFVSRRDGRFEIYTILPDGSNEMRFTSTAEQESCGMISPDGTTVLFSTNDTLRLFVTDIDGSNRRAISPGGASEIYGGPQWSPRDNLIAYHAGIPGQTPVGVWVANPDLSNARMISPNSLPITGAANFSPNGEKIAFLGAESLNARSLDLYIVNIDGSDLQLLASGFPFEASLSFTPDGQSIASHRMVGQNGQIVLVDVDSGSVETITDYTFTTRSPSVSPDGSLMVVMAYVRGVPNLFLMDFDGNLLQELTFSNYDGCPNWFLPDANWEPASGSAVVDSDGGETVGVAAAPTCQITGRSTVNLRPDPSSRNNPVGQINANESLRAIGQTLGADRFTWFLLANDAWVRADVVNFDNTCYDLPETTFDTAYTGAPPNRTSLPNTATLLQNGVGRSNGQAQNNGVFQVEYFCTSRGLSISQDNNNWYCNSGATRVYTLRAQDFDLICQQTYGIPNAFAFQTGDSNVPAYRWTCYSLPTNTLSALGEASSTTTSLPSANNTSSEPPAEPVAAADVSGTIIFESYRDGNAEIYRMNADGSDLVNLTNNDASDTAPIWSADGNLIAFVSDRDGDPAVYIMNADGEDLRRVGEGTSPGWAQHDQLLAFVCFDNNGVQNACIADATGNIVRQFVVESPIFATPLRWSPDGRYIIADSVPAAILFDAFTGQSQGFFYSASDSWNYSGGWLNNTQFVLWKLLYGPVIYDVGDSTDFRDVPVTGNAFNFDGGAFSMYNVSDFDQQEYPFILSPSTALLAVSMQHFDNEVRDLLIIDMSSGQVQVPLGATNSSEIPTSWSPDNRLVLITSDQDGNEDIFAVDVVRGDAVQLTDDPTIDRNAQWQPDPSASCTITAQNNVNLRTGPGTTFDTGGTLQGTTTAVGQADGADGFVWWNLDNGLWVRSDVVTAAANCSLLPSVTP